MEVLHLPGYITEEKYEIAKKYLIPKAKKELGLPKSGITFTKKAILTIINNYAREAGVRNLNKQIHKILRNIAVQIVAKKITKVTVSHTTLHKYLGGARFPDNYYSHLPVGVAIGAAWTAMGGSIFYIETSQADHSELAMELTGQAGPVMRESATIAWSFIHANITKYGNKKTFLTRKK